MSKPIFMAFATQKGGVGKSIFTTLTASYLHYKLGFNVTVVDCDKGQYSLFRMRARDLKIVESDPIHKQLFHQQLEQTAKPAYTILCSPAEDAVDVAENFLASYETPIDIVLFDLPGTVNSDGVLKCVSKMDFIFTPITSDHIVLESSLPFALSVKEHLLENSEQRLKGLYLFWNKVDARERTNLYDVYGEIITKMGLTILETQLPDSKRYKKELQRGNKERFRSTLFPPSPRMLRGSRFDELIDEILNITAIEKSRDE